MTRRAPAKEEGAKKSSDARYRRTTHHGEKLPDDPLKKLKQTAMILIIT